MIEQCRHESHGIFLFFSRLTAIDLVRRGQPDRDLSRFPFSYVVQRKRLRVSDPAQLSHSVFFSFSSFLEYQAMQSPTKHIINTLSPAKYRAEFLLSLKLLPCCQMCSSAQGNLSQDSHRKALHNATRRDAFSHSLSCILIRHGCHRWSITRRGKMPRTTL